MSIYISELFTIHQSFSMDLSLGLVQARPSQLHRHKTTAYGHRWHKTTCPSEHTHTAKTARLRTAMYPQEVSSAVTNLQRKLPAYQRTVVSAAHALPRFVEDNKYSALDADFNNTLKGYFGNDTLRLYTHFFETDGASQTLVPDSPIEVATSGDIIPGRVGMGSDSTLLESLATREMIAGKTYSLYIGQGFDRAGGKVNGSNVFGGYDSGRFTGTPHQYPMNRDNVNAMSVRIKDIVITQTSGGANQSLFDLNAFPDMKAAPESFDAQITTEQFPLSLPYQITQNFIKAASAQKDNYWGDNSLKASADFNASLSIVLEDGFTVTFSPEVLRNFSNITPVQSRDESDSSPFLLGSAFLGQVYLMADYESNNFWLAEAVQKNNMVMPETWCPKDTPEAYERPKQNQWQSQGLIGAAIGGVVGGMGCLAAAYCLAVSLLRKSDERRLKRDLAKHSSAKLEQMDVESAPSVETPPTKSVKEKVMFWKS